MFSGRRSPVPTSSGEGSEERIRGESKHRTDSGRLQRQSKPNPLFRSMSNLFQKKTRVLKDGKGGKIKQVRIKPYVEETWMTETELKVDAELPSRYFMQPESSANPPRLKLGELTIELIEMHDVVKADFITGTSDPYAVFVFEDCCAKTEYISSCLNPIWPHKSRRAAKFDVTSPCSKLYVGAFDYDADVSGGQLDDDDPLGRVEIKLSSIRPNTDYDLVYPFQHSELTLLKGERGFVRMRIRLNWLGNDRKVVTGYLKPQKNLVMSVESKKMWSSCLYCVNGKHIGDEYNWKIFMSYVNEIQGVVDLFSKPLIKFVIDTVFWVTPLLSAFLFCAWQYLVIHPTYVPGFTIFCIIIVLGESYVENAQRRPKLHRVTPLYDILFTLIAGSLGWKFRGIDAEVGDNPSNYVEMDDKLAKFGTSSKDDADEEDEYDYLTGAKKPMAKKAKEEKKEEKPDVTSTFTIFKLNTLNPMSLVLGPLQIVLKEVCHQLRTANNLFSWKDPFVSFWTSVVTFCVWVVVTFFPYAFFFFWLSRILGIILLGPQNRVIWWWLMKNKRAEDASKLKTKEEKFRALETGCVLCKKEFGLFNGKHHCRSCSDAVCDACSSHRKVVEVALFGGDRGKQSNKKKRVCDACFRGEKKVDHKAVEAAVAGVDEDGDENALIEGFKGMWNVTKKAGKGVATGGEMLGKGLVKGTVVVGNGLVEGTEGVVRGTGSVLVKTGSAFGSLFDNNYTLEVPMERINNKKFVDRPMIDRSFSCKVVVNKDKDKKD
ncbi:hypothetical protein TrLO_g4664 [Triparma laevis f. longispina]|uniref:C2 domain-containing protein n=1 Tax=Triparma laevis f. longispina TaxID=1714387 RepID=A0A9W7F9T5_9STRA|nr:hypothetical protein TrLO_g4664 [Triparma laevis f. longispina]